MTSPPPQPKPHTSHCLVKPVPTRQPPPTSPFLAAALSLKNRPNRVAIRPIEPSSPLVRATTVRPTPAEVIAPTCTKLNAKTRVFAPPLRRSTTTNVAATSPASFISLEPLPQEIVVLPQENSSKKRIARNSKRGLESDSDSTSSEKGRPTKKSCTSPPRVISKSPTPVESPLNGVLTRSRLAKLGTGVESTVQTNKATEKPLKASKNKEVTITQPTNSEDLMVISAVEVPVQVEVQEDQVKEPLSLSEKNKESFSPVTVPRQDPSVIKPSDSESQISQPSSDSEASHSDDEGPSVTKDDSPSSPQETIGMYETPESPCNEDPTEENSAEGMNRALTTLIPTSPLKVNKLSAFEIVSSKKPTITPGPVKKTSKSKLIIL